MARLRQIALKNLRQIVTQTTHKLKRKREAILANV